MIEEYHEKNFPTILQERLNCQIVYLLNKQGSCTKTEKLTYYV